MSISISAKPEKEYRHWNVTYSRPAQSLFIQKNSNELLMGSLEFHRCIKWLKFQLTLSQLCSGRQEVRKQLQCGLSSMMGEAPISQRASNSCITWVDCCWYSVATLRLTLCNPMDCSTPGFPVLHYLVEFAQSHVHRVGDAIQPSHPLSSPFPPAFNLSQHQGFFFQWVSSSHQVAKVLELQFKHQSFQWIFRVDVLQDWLVWSTWVDRRGKLSFMLTYIYFKQGTNPVVQDPYHDFV